MQQVLRDLDFCKIKFFFLEYLIVRAGINKINLPTRSFHDFHLSLLYLIQVISRKNITAVEVFLISKPFLKIIDILFSTPYFKWKLLTF